MPNYDKTGPAGNGPMTGQGLETCSDSKQTKSANNINQGMGGGFGKGRRREACQGRGFRGNTPVSLEEQEKFLEQKLETVKKLKESNTSE